MVGPAIERQMFPIELIAADHVARYKFALDSIDKINQGQMRVLDASCGCGYGSWILSHGHLVCGVDIHEPAIEYARINYSGPKYICGDILKKPWKSMFDVAVSFETIEHLKEPLKALKYFRQSADYLFCSVPNEEVLPFKAEMFAGEEFPHIRHYTPIEFAELLDEAGWTVLSMQCQKDQRDHSVVYGTDGRFLIYTCV